MNPTIVPFLNLLWLRPENAIFCTLRSDALKDIQLNGNSADICCGDGTFPFIHYGGRFEETFDAFVASDLATSDVYDSYHSSYKPPIKEYPTTQYDLGLDLKKNSLRRAEALSFYKKLSLFNGCSKFPANDQQFETVTCFAAINHIERVDVFINECHRILEDGGTLIIEAYSDKYVNYYSELESFFPQKWVNLIERDMRKIWPTIGNWKYFLDLFKTNNFSVEQILPSMGSERFAKSWNIGFRPLVKELIALRNIANNYEPFSLNKIKKDWVKIISDLAEPFLVNEADVDDAAGYLFILKKN
jgi:ubiquinone/menaquinone biosynthesis C-methylase UbiE